MRIGCADLSRETLRRNVKADPRARNAGGAPWRESLSFGEKRAHFSRGPSRLPIASLWRPSPSFRKGSDLFRRPVLMNRPCWPVLSPNGTAALAGPFSAMAPEFSRLERCSVGAALLQRVSASSGGLARKTAHLRERIFRALLGTSALPKGSGWPMGPALNSRQAWFRALWGRLSQRRERTRGLWGALKGKASLGSSV